MTRGRSARGHAASALIVACVAIGCERARLDEPRRSDAVSTTRPLDGLGRRFRELSKRLEDAAARARVEHRTFLLEGRSAVIAVDASRGRCTTFVGLAGGGVKDLSLAIQDEDGIVLGSDAIAGEGALVRVCLADDDDLRSPRYLVVSAGRGAGAVVVGAFESDLGPAPGVAALFDDLVAPRQPFTELDRELRRLRAAVIARGFEPMSPARVEGVAEGDVLRMPVQLDIEHCYAVLARGGDGLVDVDVFVFDPSGVEVARDLGAGTQVALEHCPDGDGRFIVEWRAYEGTGGLGMALLSGPRGRAAEAPEDPTADVATRGEVERALDGLGFGPSEPVATGTIATGETRSHPLAVDGGCRLVEAQARAAYVDLDLYLAEPDGAEIDRDSAFHATARVAVCRATPASLVASVKAYGGATEYTLVVRGAPAGVTELAELRLLEAVAALRTGSSGTGHGAPHLEEQFVLEETESRTLPIVVPAGQCVTVVAAGGDSARDVDVRLRADGRLVSSDTGPGAYGAVRHCASETNDLSLEVLMYRGRGMVTVQAFEAKP